MVTSFYSLVATSTFDDGALLGILAEKSVRKRGSVLGVGNVSRNRLENTPNTSSFTGIIK
jgi:hypothetical protein